MLERQSLPRASYTHRQFGWTMLGFAAVPYLCLAVFLTLAPPGGRQLPPGLVPGIFALTAIAAVAFSSLGVTVTRDYVVARFLIVRKSIPIERIAHIAQVRTRWYEGWGIHWTRRGMLYNVGGFDAIRIELDNGRAVMIGTDDPKRLRTAIERAVAERHAVDAALTASRR